MMQFKFQVQSNAILHWLLVIYHMEWFLQNIHTTRHDLVTHVFKLIFLFNQFIALT